MREFGLRDEAFCMRSQFETDVRFSGGEMVLAVEISYQLDNTPRIVRLDCNRAFAVSVVLSSVELLLKPTACRLESISTCKNIGELGQVVSFSRDEECGR
jgi:hypothetical protein